MTDQDFDRSHLDSRYFVDNTAYNCPFCNRRHVPFLVKFGSSFDWTNRRTAWVYIVRCRYCGKESLHLSFKELHEVTHSGTWVFKNLDLDKAIMTSIPSSVFTVDERVPAPLRDLITEAQGCLKMNFLTGASAATRKAIYELTILQGVGQGPYEERIRALKRKYPIADETLFDTLGHIQDMTSDSLHEQSWEKWDSATLRFVLETLRAVLYDIYVEPAVRSERAKRIQQLQQQVAESAKKTSRPGRPKDAVSGADEESATESD